MQELSEKRRPVIERCYVAKHVAVEIGPLGNRLEPAACVELLQPASAVRPASVVALEAVDAVAAERKRLPLAAVDCVLARGFPTIAPERLENQRLPFAAVHSDSARRRTMSRCHSQHWPRNLPALPT